MLGIGSFKIRCLPPSKAACSHRSLPGVELGHNVPEDSVKGLFFYLYMIVDVWSRKIIAAQIFAEESMDHSAMLLAHACMIHGVQPEELVLYSDNGGPIKGAAMSATLHKLGVIASFSRLGLLLLRHFIKIWRRQAHFIIPAKSNNRPKVLRTLGKGDYLCQSRIQDHTTLIVRVLRLSKGVSSTPPGYLSAAPKSVSGFRTG